MSTSALIKIVDHVANRTREVNLYKHFDGYPRSTLPLLKSFLQSVKVGYDIHVSSQLAHALIIYGALRGDRIEPIGDEDIATEYCYVITFGEKEATIQYYGPDNETGGATIQLQQVEDPRKESHYRLEWGGLAQQMKACKVACENCKWRLKCLLLR